MRVSPVRLRAIWMTNRPPSVLLHCWLGRQTCRNIVFVITYNLSSGTETCCWLQLHSGLSDLCKILYENTKSRPRWWLNVNNVELYVCVLLTVCFWLCLQLTRLRWVLKSSTLRTSDVVGVFMIISAVLESIRHFSGWSQFVWYY